MNAIYELNTVDNIITDNLSKEKEFYEFSAIMTQLTRITDYSPFMEDVKDSTIGVGNFAAVAKKNTMDTTKDLAGAYGNITDANANVIKGTWDIFMRALQLVTRATSYIINKISRIPKFILRVGDRAMDLPSEVRSKIRGDITLYISADDIGNVYNKLLIARLTEYITLASGLSKGEFFSTFFNRHRSVEADKSKGVVKNLTDNAKSLVIGQNDMKLCRKMDGVFEHLENMEFKPRVIKMNDESIVNIYFGNSKSINFTDNYGKKHESSYFDALNILIKDLESKKDELENIQKLVGDKLHSAEINQSYNKLGNPEKYRLQKTISQIAKVVTITGNFIKYAITDLNTINNSIDKILNKVSNIPKVDGKKATNTPADKVNAKV